MDAKEDPQMISRDGGGSEGDKKWGCTPCPAVLESGEDLALGSARTASPRLEQNQQIQGAEGSFHLVVSSEKLSFLRCRINGFSR